MPDRPPENPPAGQRDPDPSAPATRSRGMGRGLSAILPRSRADEQGLREIPLELVEPNPSQPRRAFDQDALVALAESIRARGVLQPVVVRPLAGGRFELIAGERRLRAAVLAQIETIPAVVRQTEDDERLDLALAENMARVDLNPIEEARACAMLVEDLGLTKEEVGRRVGKSRVAISNLIRILELPDEALDLIASGALSEGHGRAILTEKDHDRRRTLARDARDHGWSVRQTEAHARGDDAQDRPRREPIAIHPDQADALAAAEDALTAAIGYEVKVRPRGDGAKAELVFDTPAEAIDLAEKLLRGNAPGLSEAA